jgi:hypothetical protein
VDDREYGRYETIKRVEEVKQLNCFASSIGKLGIQGEGEIRNNKHNK